MVEGARLESVYTGNRIAGSNPASSAILRCDAPLYPTPTGGAPGLLARRTLLRQPVNPVGSSRRNYAIHRHQMFPSRKDQVFAHFSVRWQNHISAGQVAEKQRRFPRA